MAKRKHTRLTDHITLDSAFQFPLGDEVTDWRSRGEWLNDRVDEMAEWTPTMQLTFARMLTNELTDEADPGKRFMLQSFLQCVSERAAAFATERAIGSINYAAARGAKASYKGARNV